MTANKNLFTQIEDVLARNSANVTANLLGIAQIFAKLDERLAGMEAKLDKLFAERPPQLAGNCTTKEQEKDWVSWLDRRMNALDREQLELMQEVKAFAENFKQRFAETDAMLTQLQKLLAQRPSDPPPRPN